jgi:cob(I)alamin adenosyltransferase
MKNSTAYDKYTSIAALIGNIEELNAELGFNPDKRALTLSEALMEILPKIQAELETLPYTF